MRKSESADLVIPLSWHTEMFRSIRRQVLLAMPFVFVVCCIVLLVQYSGRDRIEAVATCVAILAGSSVLAVVWIWLATHHRQYVAIEGDSVRIKSWRLFARTYDRRAIKNVRLYNGKRVLQRITTPVTVIDIRFARRRESLIADRNRYADMKALAYELAARLDVPVEEMDFISQ